MQFVEQEKNDTDVFYFQEVLSSAVARQLDMVGVFALAFIVVGVALILGGVLNTFDKRVNSWATDASARA
jgi:ABC-type uncharacterized transport system YnjBCD permease subunit